MPSLVPGSSVTPLLICCVKPATTKSSPSTRDQHALDKLAEQGIPTHRVDSGDAAALRAAVQGFDALVNALPYYLAVNVAAAAKGAGRPLF